MRKNILFASAFIAMLTLTGCGAGTTKNTSLLNGYTPNTAGISNALNSVIGELLKGQTSAADITGTWTYNAPKIVFETENLLSQLGGAVASSKMEAMLEKQLNRIGMSAGKSKLTLNSDKSYTLVTNKRTYNGTYTFDSSSHKLVLQGSLGLSSLTCTATINGKELYMLFDADKLLSFATGIAGNSSNLTSLASMLNNYNGLKLGWSMTR